jgi:hypothetical protein
MARTKKQTTSYNGFAFPLQPDTELGLAMLIAEDEEGHHEPVAVASTINEAKEIAEATCAAGCAASSAEKIRGSARTRTRSGLAESTATTASPTRSRTS